MKKLTVYLCLFFFCISIFPSTIQGNTESTSDVDKAYSLFNLSLFLGDSNGLALDRPILRSEGAAMLIRILGVEEEAKKMNYPHPYKDVPKWASPYIGYCYAKGITSGINATTFGAMDYMTADQYATFMLRALGYSDKLGDFSWNKAVVKLGELGIITPEDQVKLMQNSFKRLFVAGMSYDVLKAPMKNKSDLLIEQLVNNGTLTADSVRKEGLMVAEEIKPVVVNQLVLSQPYATMKKSEKLQLTYILTPNTLQTPLTWSSSDTKVATVSSKGEIIAVGQGTTLIIAAYDATLIATCTVTVVDTAPVTPTPAAITPTPVTPSPAAVTPPPIVPTPPVVVEVKPQFLTLNKSALNMEPGKSDQLIGTITPTVTQTTIKWTSSNENIAKVDANGVVTGIGEGSATITGATYNNITATCSVTIKKVVVTIPMASIAVNQGSYELDKGATASPVITINPQNTTNKSLICTSSNPSVATVDRSTGFITSVGVGTAVITISDAATQTITAQINVAVYQSRGYIVNGTYNIKNSSSNYTLDVSNAGTANKTNVQVMPLVNNAAQQYDLSGDGRGFKLSPRCSTGRVVDVFRTGGTANGPIGNGNNVDIYDPNDPDAQYWNVMALSDGSYAILLDSNKSLALTIDGSNVCVKTYTGASTQRWQFISTTPVATPSTTPVGYVPRDTAPVKPNAFYYSTSNIFYGPGLSPDFTWNNKPIYGNCTWYVSGRMAEAFGIYGVGAGLGNAGDWWDSNIRLGKYKYGQTPKVGAIVCWNNNKPDSIGFGHVAVVERIVNGQLYVSQSYFQNTLFHYAVTSYNNYIQGYIYPNE